METLPDSLNVQSDVDLFNENIENEGDVGYDPAHEDLIEDAASLESVQSESGSELDLNAVINWLDNYNDNTAPLSDPEQILAAPNASTSVEFPDHSNIYTLSINNHTYRVLFPIDAALDTVDGFLINTGSSNITGVILEGSDSLDVAAYHSYFYTLYPVTSTSAQTNLYNYNASGYLTYYYPRVTGSGLSTTTTYSNARVVDEPRLGHSFGSYEFIIIALLLILVLSNFVRSLFT